MISLIDIDRKNICGKEFTVPQGNITWNLTIVPNETFHLASPMSMFVDIVLLDNVSKYSNYSYAYDSIGVQRVSITKNIEEIKIIDNNEIDILNECSHLLNSSSKILFSQYMLHCLRKCSFLDENYENYTVLKCSPGTVDKTIILDQQWVNNNLEFKSFLFKRLFTYNEKIITYASKIVNQGLKTFIAKYCIKNCKDNFHELFDAFNSPRIWYRPNLI